MRLVSTAILAIVCAAPVLGADADRQVTERVLTEVRRWAEVQQAAPMVFASRTAGGADLFVREWMIRHRGKVVGFELADAYEQVNRDRQPLTGESSDAIKLIDLEGATPNDEDWSAIEAAFPGTRTLVVLSRPTFDSMQDFSVVRADVFRREPEATTLLFDVERQSDGSWKVKRMAQASYGVEYSNQAHLHTAGDQAYYHDRDE